jgi:hypothetical protein
MASNKLNLDFSGGMVSHTSPLIIKDNECELILNYNLDKVGALTRRNGYELYATNTLYHTSGLASMMKTDTRASQAWLTTNDAPFAAATKRITYYYKVADDAWTTTDDNTQQAYLPTTGSASQLYKTRFVSFLNYMFRLNGGDAPLSFLVTTPQTKTTTNLTDNETSAALAIKPYLGVAFSNRLFFNDNTDGKRSRLYYSSLGVSGGTITWDTDATTGQWRDINPDDGDFITALQNNGNYLLIFKNTAIYRYIFDQVEADRVIGVGTCSQESVATNYDVGITFFANPKGIYTYTNGEVKLISGKIQEYIDAVTGANWNQCSGGVDKEHYYLSVGDITVNSRTITNAIFVYHIFLDAWTIYSLAEQVTCFAEIGGTYPAKFFVFGTGNGGVYKFSTATSDIFGSSTVRNIDAEVLTKEHLLTFPEKTTLENIDVIAIQGGDTKVSYQLERNLTGKEGDFISCKERLNKRVNTFRVGKEMHTVRLRLADNSIRPSIIEGYNLEHTPKKDR